MKKIAVFGNAAGGKSTLSKNLSEIINLPYYPLDKIRYFPNGKLISEEDYQKAHQEILNRDQWIIDGFGDMKTLWLRLDTADTLVYIDLPFYVHCWWAFKRFLSSFWITPEGWPEGSPVIQSGINCVRVLGRCHKYLTPKYRLYVEGKRYQKTVFHLKSSKEIEVFLKKLS